MGADILDINTLLFGRLFTD